MCNPTVEAITTLYGVTLIRINDCSNRQAHIVPSEIVAVLTDLDPDLDCEACIVTLLGGKSIYLDVPERAVTDALGWTDEDAA